MKKLLFYTASLCLLAACGKNLGGESAAIRFEFGLPETKVADGSFEEGDEVSLWSVEQRGSEQMPLQLGGNFINNEAVRFSGGQWTPARTLYWSDTACDFYAVYPHLDNVVSVEAQPFSVVADQNSARTDSALGGYEASDLLYASKTGVTRADGAVRLQFRHLLSKCVVKIVKGEKFEGEIPGDIVVHIYNTTTTGLLDLQKGSIQKDAFGAKNTITAKKLSNQLFEAVVLPQNIEKRSPLIEVTMGGIAYLLEYSLSFRPGYKHTIELTLNTSPDQEMIEINIDADQEGWD